MFGISQGRIERVGKRCSKCQHTDRFIREGYKICNECVEYGKLYRASHDTNRMRRGDSMTGFKSVKRFGNLVCQKCGQSNFRIRKRSIFCNTCTPAVEAPRFREVRKVLFNKTGSPFVWLNIKGTLLQKCKNVRIKERDGALVITPAEAQL